MDKKLRSLFKHNINNERKKLENRHIGEASEFYFACRNGDIDTVKKVLPTLSYEQLNKLESNGSTSLHAATYYGHIEIVRLLLNEYGCQRNQHNLYGLTAYEEAQTNEMKQIYHRLSNENHFSNHLNDIHETFKFILLTNQNKSDDDDNNDDELLKPNQKWLIDCETNEEIKKQLDSLNSIKTLLQLRLGRSIMKQTMKHILEKDECDYEEGEEEEEYFYIAKNIFSINALQKILDEYITIDHPEYKHCYFLLNEYIQNGKIESLLTLYTLETPFYHHLLIKSNLLAFPLFMHLSNLKQRFYQGYSYCDVQMTRKDLSEYRWALTNSNNIILTQKFISTSIIRHVAEKFTYENHLLDKLNVLLIFYFPQICDTAINLSKISQYELPCISNFENEYEVLITPRTIFKVKNIENTHLNEHYIIHLENISREHKSILETIKSFFKQEFKNRFRH